MLTSQAREILAGVETVIVDEIHAVAATKRGAHLALTLERLAELSERDRAAHRPVGHAEPARGGRPLPRRARGARARIVDAGIRKPLDLQIHVPVESMVEPDQVAGRATLDSDRPGGEATRSSIWPAIYPELLELVREHSSTIVFVNNRRGAERLRCG